MNNNVINSLNNTYQLTVDNKTIPFNVSISNIGDEKISNIKKAAIKSANKKDIIYDCIFLITGILMMIFIGIESCTPRTSNIYNISIQAIVILTFLLTIEAMYICFKKTFFDIEEIGVIKGWYTYQTASEIAFALNNIEPNSEIKLKKDIVKKKSPDTYLQIKDNDTKRINTYFLDDFYWDIHDKDEVILIANSTEINDIKSKHPVYEMKILVPAWIANEYFIYSDLIK